MKDPETIQDVSDTAIWVAQYRVRESARPDAMFRDPLAKLLVGERGEQIAKSFGRLGRYTEWTVISRTVLIDDFLTEAINGGVDAVINLGAGLDTRPWRMNLPSSLQWIEADFPHMVEYKQRLLRSHVPKCRLESVGVDLADDVVRRDFLAGAAPDAKNIFVLTEGVVPYLTEARVAALATDLTARPQVSFWLAEYFAPQTYRYLKARTRSGLMANAPFQFFPQEWHAFFAQHGWVKKETRYSTEVAERFNRRPPLPWLARLLLMMMPKERIEQMKKMTGFVLMKRNG